MISLAFDIPLRKDALLQKRGCINLFLYYSISDKTNLENNSKQMCVLIGLKPCFYLTIRLCALNFYELIVDEAEDQINYHLIEIESKLVEF